MAEKFESQSKEVVVARLQNGIIAQKQNIVNFDVLGEKAALRKCSRVVYIGIIHPFTQ